MEFARVLLMSALVRHVIQVMNAIIQELAIRQLVIAANPHQRPMALPALEEYVRLESVATNVTKLVAQQMNATIRDPAIKHPARAALQRQRPMALLVRREHVKKEIVSAPLSVQRDSQIAMEMRQTAARLIRKRMRRIAADVDMFAVKARAVKMAGALAARTARQAATGYVKISKQIPPIAGLAGMLVQTARPAKMVNVPVRAARACVMAHASI
jgi:hypothetical protein